MCLGTVVALSARFVMHFFSGWILWGAWAASFFEGFDETTGTGIGKWFINAFDGQMLSCMYSLFYNALYMVPEIIITLILAVIISRIPKINETI